MSENYGIEIGTPSNDRGGESFILKSDKAIEAAVLPPLGELAAEGVWHRGHAWHWGYLGSNKRHRFFACIERKDMKTKMITTRCPECDRLAKFKAEYEKKKELFCKPKSEGGKGMDPRTADEALKMYTEHLFKFSRSYKEFINVVTPDDKIGVLQLSGKHLNVFKEQRKKLQARGIEPISINQSVTFEFKFTGRGGNTNYFAEPVTVDNGNGAFALKMRKLPESVLRRLKSEAKNLNKMYTVLTAEQIQQLIDGGGAPAVVDAVFSAGQSRIVDTPVDESLDDDVAGVAQVEAASPFGSVEPQTATAAPVVIKPDAEMPVIGAGFQTATPSAAPSKAVEEMDLEEFKAFFGGGK